MGIDWQARNELTRSGGGIRWEFDREWLLRSCGGDSGDAGKTDGVSETR